MAETAQFGSSTIKTDQLLKNMHTTPARVTTPAPAAPAQNSFGANTIATAPPTALPLIKEKPAAPVDEVKITIIPEAKTTAKAVETPVVEAKVEQVVEQPVAEKPETPQLFANTVKDYTPAPKKNEAEERADNVLASARAEQAKQPAAQIAEKTIELEKSEISPTAVVNKIVKNSKEITQKEHDLYSRMQDKQCWDCNFSSKNWYMTIRNMVPRASDGKGSEGTAGSILNKIYNEKDAETGKSLYVSDGTREAVKELKAYHNSTVDYNSTTARVEDLMEQVKANCRRGRIETGAQLLYTINELNKYATDSGRRKLHSGCDLVDYFGWKPNWTSWGFTYGSDIKYDLQKDIYNFLTTSISTKLSTDIKKDKD